jgi:hypothetical protein
MNPWLAEMYGTAAAAQPEQESLSKTAQLELFAKLAAEENIDLSTLTPEQVNALFVETFSKAAEESGAEEKKEEKQEEKKDEHEAKESPAEEKVEEKAKAEYFGKKEAQAKLAEADLMGRVMAHSFVQELGLIDQAKEAQAKEAGAMQHIAGAADKAKGFLGTTKGKAIAGAAAGTAAAGTGLALHLAKKKGEEKSASAIDALAGKRAVELAKEAGFDPEEASARVNAVLTLGAGESTKVAHTTDFETGVAVRGLELLEAAGYPVNWEEVFTA